MNVKKGTATGGGGSKKKEDGAIDQEQQFILRLPVVSTVSLIELKELHKLKRCEVNNILQL